MSGLVDATLGFCFQGLDALEVAVAGPGGPGRTFTAYFDAPYVEHTLGDGFAVRSAGYLLTCKAADAAGLRPDQSALLVAGREFIVAAVRPVGPGLAEVDLVATDELTREAD